MSSLSHISRSKTSERKMSRTSIEVPPLNRQEITETINNHFRRETSPWLEGLSDVLKKDITSVSSNADSSALEKFLQMEVLCKETNRSLRKATCDIDLDPVLHRAQRLIAKCLGYDFDCSELIDSGRFGPGSSYACRGSKASPSHKFRSNELSRNAHVFVSKLIQKYAPAWALTLTDSSEASPLFAESNCGRLSFVPKNNEISRTIIVEPELNTFFQLALGQMIRKRVKRSFRLDLNTSDVVNRRLAQKGSIDNSLATIDFSSASDTLSLELVRLLLPPMWFEALCLFRTEFVKLPGGHIMKLEKISSMGNGYTWELESLIFHALAVAVCDIEGYNSFWVSTFGDDVIIPSGVFPRFADTVSKLGLIINKAKSFVDGPFRESCGKDYYRGLDVRCLYLGSSSDYLSIINFINQLQRSHHTTYNLLAKKLIRFIPERLQVWGHREDGCLWRASDAFKRHQSWEGVVHPHIRGIVKRYPYPNDRFTILSKVHTLTQDRQDYMSREIDHYIIDMETFTPVKYA